MHPRTFSRCPVEPVRKELDYAIALGDRPALTECILKYEHELSTSHSEYRSHVHYIILQERVEKKVEEMRPTTAGSATSSTDTIHAWKAIEEAIVCRELDYTLLGGFECKGNISGDTRMVGARVVFEDLEYTVLKEELDETNDTPKVYPVISNKPGIPLGPVAYFLHWAWTEVHEKLATVLLLLEKARIMEEMTRTQRVASQLIAAQEELDAVSNDVSKLTQWIDKYEDFVQKRATVRPAPMIIEAYESRICAAEKELRKAIASNDRLLLTQCICEVRTVVKYEIDDKVSDCKEMPPDGFLCEGWESYVHMLNKASELRLGMDCAPLMIPSGPIFQIEVPRIWTPNQPLRVQLPDDRSFQFMPSSTTIPGAQLTIPENGYSLSPAAVHANTCTLGKVCTQTDCAYVKNVLRRATYHTVSLWTRNEIGEYICPRGNACEPCNLRNAARKVRATPETCSA